MTDEYLDVNRANWDERASAHAASPGYGIERLLADPQALSEVVAFDRPRLGDIAGLETVHLQCHIGTDTLSLARLGANVTGVDLSPESITQARRLAQRAGASIGYVVSDVYSAPEALEGRTFDLVYTGIGALCWLPDIDRWAATVAALLNPGGRLFIREGHPMLWTMSDEELHPVHPYFETPEPLVYDDGTTYVETDHVFSATRTMEWNHSLGQIITALLQHGMGIDAFEEHDSVPWEAISGVMTMDERGEWRLTDRPERLAASYTLKATRLA